MRSKVYGKVGIILPERKKNTDGIFFIIIFIFRFFSLIDCIDGLPFSILEKKGGERVYH